MDEETTILFPITDHASQITGIMTPAMDDVLTGKKPPESLTEAGNQVTSYSDSGVKGVIRQRSG